MPNLKVGYSENGGDKVDLHQQSGSHENWLPENQMLGGGEETQCQGMHLPLHSF